MAYLGLIILGIISGFFIRGSLTEYFYQKSKKESEELDKDIWENVYNNLVMNKTHFNSRYGDAVYLETHLDYYNDKVKILYFINGNRLSIADSNNEIVKTTVLIKDFYIQKIIDTIIWKHGNDINDVADVFGIIMDKKTFKNVFKMDYSSFSKMIDNLKILSDENNFDTYEDNYKNKKVYDIDLILDKISKSGINSLSIDEKNYLNKYSNGEED